MTKGEFRELWLSSSNDIEIIRLFTLTHNENIIGFTVRVKPGVDRVNFPGSSKVIITSFDFRTREIDGGIIQSK